MAKKDAEVSVLIRAKDLTATVIGRFRRNWRAATTVLKDVTRVVLGATAAFAGMVLGLTKLTQQGSAVNAVKAAFAKITGDETRALEQLRVAASGTVDDFKLMSLANQAFTLGIATSVEEYAEMIRLSRALGRAQGIDATRALEVFTLALARQSAQRADDLGLNLKGVEASKFAAVFMEQARQKVAEMTSDMGRGAEAGDRFAASVTNMKNRLAEMASDSPLVAAFFDQFTGIVDGITDAITQQDWGALAELFGAIGRMLGDALAFGMKKSIEALPENTSFDKNVEGFLRFLGLDIDRIKEWWKENFVTQRDILDFGTFEEAMAGARAELDAILDRLRGGRRTEGAGDGGVLAARGAARSLDGLPAVTGPSSAFFARSFAVDLQSTAQRRGRRRFLERQAEEEGGIQLLDPDDIDFTTPNPTEAAGRLANASDVAVGALESMASAAVSESARMETAIVGALQNVIANIRTKDGGLFGSTFLGGALGVGLGLFGSLFGRGRREAVPVRLQEVDDRAADALNRRGGPPIRITTIIEQGGVEIERIERELIDRQQRDEVVRYGRGSLFGRTG